ncbi:hypothetical protein K32_16700 [Kaistia sp. 32K]|uniref:porin n=1 Tax=Kaistia sp. 32K TaxID=2795690 RepID=UPI0019164E5B|nr:porin [Kaistia sp. 32K]BCP53053.1 hypothetical protein K32_16700 [Kaistia sp. 32K]
MAMRITILGAAVLLAVAPAAVRAAPVEYVRVCNTFGPGYQYIPGTETCVRVDTGETARQTENGPVFGQTDLAERIDQAFASAKETSRAAAVIGALPVPIIEQGHNFALAGNFAQFENDGAFGLAGAFRINSNVTFNGGLAIGADEGKVGGRIGLNVSW